MNEHETNERPLADDSADSQEVHVQRERIATAYHEAGHAVMALILGRPVDKVTIVPAKLQLGQQRLGSCKLRKGRSKPSKDELEDEVLILLAGMIGESHFTGNYSERGAARDLRAVESMLAGRASGARQLERLGRRMLEKAAYLLAAPNHVHAIKLISRELLLRETISGRAARHFFEQAVRSDM